MKNFIFIGILALAFTSCTKSTDEDNQPDNGSEELKAAEAYYDVTLNPVISVNCVSCHAGYHSKSDASNYGVFNNAKNNASGMYNLVNAGTMPKGGAKLPQSEIDKFQAFLDLVNAIN